MLPNNLGRLVVKLPITTVHYLIGFGRRVNSNVLEGKLKYPARGSRVVHVGMQVKQDQTKPG